MKTYKFSNHVIRHGETLAVDNNQQIVAIQPHYGSDVLVVIQTETKERVRRPVDPSTVQV